MNCSCGKKNCRCGGKGSKSVRGKYAEGGAVTPVQNPAVGPFAQGTNKYLNMIQQRRADARSSLSTRNPADVVAKYFPPPPPPAAAPPAAAPAEPAKQQESRSDRMWSDGMTPAQIRQAQQDKTFGKQPSKGPGYTGVRDMFDGGGPGKSGSTFKGGPLSGTLNKVGVKPIGSGGGNSGTTKPAKVAKDFSKPSGSGVGKPRGGR